LISLAVLCVAFILKMVARWLATIPDLISMHQVIQKNRGSFPKACPASRNKLPKSSWWTWQPWFPRKPGTGSRVHSWINHWWGKGITARPIRNIPAGGDGIHFPRNNGLCLDEGRKEVKLEQNLGFLEMRGVDINAVDSQHGAVLVWGSGGSDCLILRFIEVWD
jgi:hypothetical protein